MARPVVLIHGMWCTGANFGRVVEGLRPRGHRCYTPTLPAHEVGVPHPEVGDKGLRDYLAFLEDYLRGLALEQAPILVGHSMGGLLAQQLAARIQPFALVLLTPAAPAGIFSLHPSSLISFAGVVARWGWWRKPQKFGPGQYLRRAVNQVPPERQRALYQGMVEESGRVVFELGFWFLDPARASAVDASAIRCPVYVVSGGCDRLTPAAIVRKVAALYPQASLRHYPDRGHWVLDDAETDEMTTEVANWLQAHEHRAKRGEAQDRR